jgi:hypothetical protein
MDYKENLHSRAISAKELVLENNFCVTNVVFEILIFLA